MAFMPELFGIDNPTRKKFESESCSQLPLKQQDIGICIETTSKPFPEWMNYPVPSALKVQPTQLILWSWTCDQLSRIFTSQDHDDPTILSQKTLDAVIVYLIFVS